MIRNFTAFIVEGERPGSWCVYDAENGLVVVPDYVPAPEVAEGFQAGMFPAKAIIKEITRRDSPTKASGSIILEIDFKSPMRRGNDE